MERDRENRREEGNCRKGGSLVRHYPQSNPQFQVRRNTERDYRKKEIQTRMELLNNTQSLVCVVSNNVVSNFSPSLQLSTSGLVTLAGSAKRSHCRQHRHGSHTISPYTPRMTNPLSPCHRLNSLKSQEETLTLSLERERKKSLRSG